MVGPDETVIACVNAWQISGSDVYLQSVDTVWTFVKDHMVDKEYGEWYSDCFDGEPKKGGSQSKYVALSISYGTLGSGNV